MAHAQDLFFDDFSGDLSQWEVWGNPGNLQISDGHLAMELGYQPSWFLTKERFNFGSEAIRYDVRFEGGGIQHAVNHRETFMELLLGATSFDRVEGAFRGTFNFKEFNMYRLLSSGSGWKRIAMMDDPHGAINGSRVKAIVERDGLTGSLWVDGEQKVRFIYQGSPFEGGFAFRLSSERRCKIDNVRFYQIGDNGEEISIVEDNFNRTNLGEMWISESLKDGVTISSLTPSIEDGALVLQHDATTNDSWLRTVPSVVFENKKTVFEFTLVERTGGNSVNPDFVVGSKPFVASQTTGAALIERIETNTLITNKGLVNGRWLNRQSTALVEPPMGSRVQYVTKAGGMAGAALVEGVTVYPWYAYGPPVQGGVGFRLIAGRNHKVDDLRVYTVTDGGNEVTLFEDDFNRSEIGEDWVNESLTVGSPLGSLNPRIEDGILVLEHDGSLNDTWFRLNREFPFQESKIVLEFTLIDRFGDIAYNPSVVIGTVPWVDNETVGSVMMDGLTLNNVPARMDGSGGNVWVNGGPLPGTLMSLEVAADGRSGILYANRVPMKHWVFSELETPITPGAVGIIDPWSTRTPSIQIFDDVRVIRVDGTNVYGWMNH